MKKCWLWALPVLLTGCANTVEVKKAADFKCGEQIIHAEVFDDNSMIVRINGVNNVLTKVASASGERYENIASRVVFSQNDGDTYLTINNRRYPLCQEIVR